MSGAAMLIVKDGKTIYQNFTGLSSIAHEVPITKSTRFPIGSITKQFTATSILLLQEEGRLSTEDFIEEYLPEFPQDRYPVRLRHLLVHTSGIPSGSESKTLKRSFRGTSTAQDFRDFIKDEPLLFPPGEQSDYSNNGFILLGLIIEKVSGMSYADFIKSRIFDPLEMNDTQVGDYTDVIAQRATGYTRDNEGTVIHAPHHSALFAAGAIISTPSDMNKWAEALFSGRIISDKSLAEMLKNRELTNGDLLNMGFGWEINKIGDQLSYEHSGSQPGYKSYSIYLPKEKLYVITMQNAEYGSPSPLSIKAAALAIGNPYPAETDVIDLSESSINHFVGTYLLNGTSERVVGMKDGKLFYKAPGGLSQSLRAINDSTLVFNNSYRQLKFGKKNNLGFSEMISSNRIRSAKGVKTSMDAGEENKAVSLSIETMQQYVGTYAIDGLGEMSVFLEKGALFAEPKGSDKLELIPKGANKFFIEEIGAEIEFTLRNVDGTEVQEMNILLEGNKMKGLKK